MPEPAPSADKPEERVAASLERIAAAFESLSTSVTAILAHAVQRQQQEMQHAAQQAQNQD